VLSEYRIHNADVSLRYDATVDDLIDVIEGNRVYIPCLYALNKIDQLTLEELDVIDKIPHYVPISAHLEWNLDGLLEKTWEYLDLTRMYAPRTQHDTRHGTTRHTLTHDTTHTVTPSPVVRSPITPRPSFFAAALVPWRTSVTGSTRAFSTSSNSTPSVVSCAVVCVCCVCACRGAYSLLCVCVQCARVG
jgi:hypothetical protein